MDLLHISSSDVVAVGSFGKSVGLHGGIKIFLLTDFHEVLSQGARFYLKYHSSLHDIFHISSNVESVRDMFIPFSLHSYNPHSSVVYINEITRREHSDLMRNMKFYSTIEESRNLCELQKDEFFFFDIVGMSVVDDGEMIGNVKDIMQIGNVYYFILSDNFYVPYIDEYVRNIDLDSKTIFTTNAILLKT